MITTERKQEIREVVEAHYRFNESATQEEKLWGEKVERVLDLDSSIDSFDETALLEFDPDTSITDEYDEGEE